MLPRGSATREREPGGGGDVSDAAHVDGAAKSAGGGGWRPALREDEPGDAADGGGEGVLAVRRACRRELRGGQAASGGAAGGFGREAGAWGVAGSRDLRVTGASGEVHGGISAGIGLGSDRALGEYSGDGPEGRGTARAHKGDAAPGGGEFA